MATIYMMLEEDVYSASKHSLLYGYRDQVEHTLRVMASKWMQPGSWYIRAREVHARFWCPLDALSARLHIETYVFRHGINFDLNAHVICNLCKFGEEPREYGWQFTKQPPSSHVRRAYSRDGVEIGPTLYAQARAKY